MTGTIFDLKEMAVHDGDGVRLTVFMKGALCVANGVITPKACLFKVNFCIRRKSASNVDFVKKYARTKNVNRLGGVCIFALTIA